MKDNQVKKLMDTLSFHPEERERYYAAFDLSGFPQDDVVEYLVKRLGEEKSRPVQEAIVTTLITIGTEAVVKGCAELLRSEDAYVRNAAVEIMRLLQRTSLGVARKLLRDPDPDVRLFAVNVLGELKVKEAVELLRRVVEEDENINVVAAAVEYVGEMGLRSEDREAVRKVRKRFSDPFLEYAVEEALRKMEV
ncbi:HEAT repeat domain-containing protein [Desulfofundulus sp. TPOSR]|uniref:PBS lyase HEAT domain protein repeat-containing protein n=1 Tax=Desulfofundulus kuznetsovii (strain DSM 6115 / VKM B-1805 / 17) TaxID=760568 RepID=A0AAU8P8N7_DESK7|nr:HEAT repeat domain-containing protein [Desulfofundulus sp. TPOSR]AEG14609.1 PBS lyase HEAT domain protein repeat-containing protein [Desulfofundulus kuznetsovii DSM 6115]NHM25896.1 HEAT repeat domain-containing protein [Desulfofundulus sp. TPOSR]